MASERVKPCDCPEDGEDLVPDLVEDWMEGPELRETGTRGPIATRSLAKAWGA